MIATTENKDIIFIYHTMKKASCILLTILFLQTANSQKITEANVTSVPLYVTSTFTISCELFEKSFAELKKTIEIQSGNFDSLNLCLNSSKFVIRNRIDVRGKIVINFDHKKIRKICFDEFGIFVEGTKYFENKRLWKFLLRHSLVEK